MIESGRDAVARGRRCGRSALVASAASCGCRRVADEFGGILAEVTGGILVLVCCTTALGWTLLVHVSSCAPCASIRSAGRCGAIADTLRCCSPRRCIGSTDPADRDGRGPECRCRNRACSRGLPLVLVGAAGCARGSVRAACSSSSACPPLAVRASTPATDFLRLLGSPLHSATRRPTQRLRLCCTETSISPVVPCSRLPPPTLPGVVDGMLRLQRPHWRLRGALLPFALAQL